jgi:AmmeMemoRadiSam system protein B
MTGRACGRAWAVTGLLVLAAGSLSCGKSPTSEVELAPASHQLIFYDEQTFFTSVRVADTLTHAPSPIAGAIVPHDWRGGEYITWLFRSLAANPPATVVVIGPNHDNEGYPGVLTSLLPWSTPFGVVQPDRERIGALVSQRAISVDEEVLTTEHSVAGIMPAISYYLPEANVVPLIIRGDATLEDSERLGRQLASVIASDTLVVAAVDFSHDLVASASERNNSVTLRALNDWNGAALLTLNNQYLDSPESIVALMAAMRQAGSGAFVLRADTNSARLRGDELAPTTSYLVGYYPAAASVRTR